MCVSNRDVKKRCVELRYLCDEYIFVAIYAPHWPKNKEYEVNCSEAYSLGIPLGNILLIPMLNKKAR